MSKRSIITGILGQDGALITKLLLEANHDVYGVYRRVSSGNNFSNIEEVKAHPRLHLIEGDIRDYAFISQLLADVKPDYYYGLAGQSHVHYSFSNPIETMDVNAMAVISQLEAIRQNSPTTRFLNAATSEMFGGLNCPDTGYDENSQLYARSPYAASKIAAFQLTRNYREAYGLFAVSTICFNHSSKYRGFDFATRRISRGVAAIKLGLEKNLKMGNLEAFRDECHADDVVRAMKFVLELEKPEDFVVASGASTSIGEMLRIVCDKAELDPGKVYVRDEKYFRPSEVVKLTGNAVKLKNRGFEFTKNVKDLLIEMYENDLKQLSVK